MKKWLRCIRGAIGMGLTWGIAWFGTGVALLLVVGLDDADVPFPIGLGMFGFLASVMFSGVRGASGRVGWKTPALAHLMR